MFDRLFGTFAEERADLPCRYGLTVPLVSNNPVKIAFHEWLKLLNDLYDARSLREVAFYLFGPPGWRPDSIFLCAYSPLPTSPPEGGEEHDEEARKRRHPSPGLSPARGRGQVRGTHL